MLAVISCAQLMVVLDGSIVNVALPAAQADLGMSDVYRQWVVTAYGLSFGGMLLLGGRLSDRFGRRLAFLVGLVGFAVASGIGGLATGTVMLLGARATQGAFAALLAPSVLAILTLTFPSGKDRASAFGIFSAVAISGGAVGLLLGGVLTERTSWRWTLLVNVIIAAAVGMAAIQVLPTGSSAPRPKRVDVPGGILATLGAAGLVYSFTSAEVFGWAAPRTLAVLVAALALLVLFIGVERRVDNPLLPLRVVTERNRAGAYLTANLSIMAMFGQFLLLTYYFQLTLGYSPIQTGLAFLPLTLCLAIGSTQIGRRLLGRVPARSIMAGGYVTAALGFLTFTQLAATSSFWHVLPGAVIVGLGSGTASIATNSLSTYAVEPGDAGVAAAMLNASQQVGGAIGTAMLSTVAASVTAASSRGGSAATMTGYAVAFAIAAALMIAAAAAAAALVNLRPTTTPEES